MGKNIEISSRGLFTFLMCKKHFDVDISNCEEFTCMKSMSSVVEHTCGALGNTYECCTSFGNMTTISTSMDRLPCLNIGDDGS
jgi:hypothetical protein